MRTVRAIALGVAMLIALPWTGAGSDAAAQVWKPLSRQKKKPKVQGTTRAKSVEKSTRKAGKPKAVKRTPAAKKKKARKKPRPRPAVVDEDDELMITEEDFPDED